MVKTGGQVNKTGKLADDDLALPEWGAFAGFVAPVAEGVGTIVDARVEALRQQHDIVIQTY